MSEEQSDEFCRYLAGHPHPTEQRSEPEGPRSRVPGGIAKGGRASGPPWLAVKAKC
ncbi:hypothetical protein GCM10007421_33520 [Halopseudomonas oceani]|nr:hypothetical protein GCM10007421_33520 [Halopseudomonas oceani]